MAQQPHDPTAGPVPADVLARHLRERATEFLRALRLHRESGAGAASEDSAEAARALRRAARRISAGLYTFQPVLDPVWSQALGPELAWVSGTLSLEDACANRLDRLLQALHRLSGPAAPDHPPGTRLASRVPDAPAPAPADGAPPGVPRPAAARRATTGTVIATVPAPDGRRAADRRTEETPPPAGPRSSRPAADRGPLTLGAAKAGALLDRQLTLARTRAHSTALRALESARFHAVADQVAVLASEVPLTPAAEGADLRPLADAARERLADAVAALPLLTAGSPYNAEALAHGLSPDSAPHPQDTPWHQVRLLLRLHRYAREALDPAAGDDPRLRAAGEALDRHRDAAEAAAAAAQAARTPRIAPATAYALGVLHADQRHEVEAARYAFQRAWQKPAAGTP
ncbi:CHAD domain-containing protein [Streptomyces sp. MA15]|uniref:CHAD domain-containing protein n=1 Tax=Streptomyces sp. MA15 TaxID=3055061 RepID=UPI0025B2303E|nr:CHAD domain-containing protein [Streptomyces sp. MA15]MDN3266352.1 CHAD domain-containing protein [Streptomyces sp. MA15]